MGKFEKKKKKKSWKLKYETIHLSELTPLQKSWTYIYQSQRVHHIRNTMQYTGDFSWKIFDNFNIFAQNIDCGYTLEPPLEAVLMSTHNICFGSTIGLPLYTPVLLYTCNSGV